MTALILLAIAVAIISAVTMDLIRPNRRETIEVLRDAEKRSADGAPNGRGANIRSRSGTWELPMWKLLLTIIAAGVVGSFLVATAEADGTGYKTYRDRMGFGLNGTKLTRPRVRRYVGRARCDSAVRQSDRTALTGGCQPSADWARAPSACWYRPRRSLQRL